ncbi:MAG: AAA family ATPase [Magnetococcales bacterium]|nr:AAA family ATPase [Magnetococcales bacterium]
MFTRLELSNFTVFEKLNLEFSPGINILVGANGTGKTHLMKLLYCIQGALTPNSKSFAEKLGAVFRPRDGDFRRLTRRRPGRTNSEVSTSWEDKKIVASWHNASGEMLFKPSTRMTLESPVFIPVKEVLSFAPGFISLYDKYRMEIDEIYYDVLKLAFLPSRRGAAAEKDKNILETIRQLIGGRVVTEGENFYLRHGNANLEMHLVAEGYRKIALVWQLIHNGSLLEGTTLFWDEPEANLNPFMMQYVAKILLLLAHRGIQVFAATHNYAFLKEIDLQKKQTPVTYFSLSDSENNGVQVNSSLSYATISPNKIADEYLRLYDLEMQKAFTGGLK